MEKPMVRIHNLETNEVIDREMTDDEFNEWNFLRTAEQTKKDMEEAKTQNRLNALSKLIDLGLTEEEIAAL